ncbi:GAF domain-containing sensor histidine kinase [Bacillus solimangrovi]|nr:GAF domain-containing sensor histidine kinase [Bacillus solimangrovi]
MNTLKSIAKTLNQGQCLEDMLDVVVAELLKVTNLETGWIFFIDEKGEHTLISDVNLPPALCVKNKFPMCEGECWCVDRFQDGRLTKPVNIMECKRLDDAVSFEWGETNDVTHHATIPLVAGTKTYGVLNVAAGGKEHFTERELSLLEAAGYQIGTAIKRMQDLQKEEKRSEMFQRYGAFTTELNRKIPARIDQLLASHFQWDGVTFTINGETFQTINKINDDNDSYTTTFSAGQSVISLRVQGSVLDEIDRDIMQHITQYVAVTYENFRLQLEQQELAKVEERNRLARDLHDSVNQLLFSLTLTVRGLKERAQDAELVDGLEYVQSLSQQALKEMRTLIWQLRPVQLNHGLVNAISTYAKTLQLEVAIDSSGSLHLPTVIEECLWRVVQECLHNIKKHAGTNDASIKIQRLKQSVTIVIHDSGKGFDYDKGQPIPSLGLKTMQERVEILNGKVEIYSKESEGTNIMIEIPIEDGGGMK